MGIIFSPLFITKLRTKRQLAVRVLVTEQFVCSEQKQGLTFNRNTWSRYLNNLA